VIGVPKAASQAELERSIAASDTEVAFVLHDVKATEIAKKGGYFYEIYLTSSLKALAEGKARDAAEIGSFSTFTVSGEAHHEENNGAPEVRLLLNSSARKLLATSLKGDPAFVLVRRGLISKEKEIQEHVDEVFFTIGEIRLEARKRTQQVLA